MLTNPPEINKETKAARFKIPKAVVYSAPSTNNKRAFAEIGKAQTTIKASRRAR